LAVLGFELSTLYLIDRWCTTWAILLALLPIFLCVCDENTFKIYSLRKSQVKICYCWLLSLWSPKLSGIAEALHSDLVHWVAMKCTSLYSHIQSPSPFLHIITAFVFLDSNYFNRWDSTSLWFWFAFPWWLAMLYIFSYTCWLFVYLLWKNLYIYSDLLPTLNVVCLLLSCLSFLGILDISLWLDRWSATIFFHSIGSLTCCWLFPLQCRSFQSDAISLVHLYFSSLGVISKIIAKLMWRSFSHMFTSRSFMVLGVTFKTLTHFELVFYIWSKKFCSLSRILLQLYICGTVVED
jgi:hypothetical protein